MFDPTITLGDIVVLGVTTPSLGVAIWKTIFYIRYRRHPLKVDFQESLHYEHKPPLKDRAAIPVGSRDLILRIQPKRLTEFSSLHIRLVDKKRWVNAPSPSRDEVAVVKILPEGLLGNVRLWTKEDFTNGLEGVFVTSEIMGTSLPHSQSRAPEEALLLTVGIKANIAWNGYLVLKSLRADGHIGYSYLPLCVEGTA